MIERQTLRQARRRRPWLAEGQAPFLVRRAITTPTAWAGARCGSGTTTRSRRTPAFPPHPARRHGDHHLCPRRRDHPSGQSGQQGPHRSRRRAGDERRHRHPPLPNIISRTRRPRSSRSGSSRRPRRPADLGREAIPESRPLGPASSPLASGFAGGRGRAADPRRRARARRDPEGGRERRNTRSAKARNLYLVPATGSVEVNGVRVNARDGAAIRDEAELDDHGTGRCRTRAGRRGVSRLSMPGAGVTMSSPPDVA